MTQPGSLFSCIIFAGSLLSCIIFSFSRFPISFSFIILAACPFSCSVIGKLTWWFVEHATDMVRSRAAARGKDGRSLQQLYYVAAVAALSAVLFAGSFGAQRDFGGRAGRAVELAGALDVNSLEEQASQGLPYSQPRQQQMSMIDVASARMQQLYDTPSVNAGALGYTSAMMRTAPITDCSGLGCVTRIPGVSASPGYLAQPEHILTDLPAAYPLLTSQFTVDALLPSVDPLLQRIQDANNAQEQTATTAINSMKDRSLQEERDLGGLEREDDDLRGKRGAGTD